jgi:hypothetical protein
MADTPVQDAINVVTVGKDDPYPTGTPPDGTLIVGRVHTFQEQTDGPVGKWNNPYERQSVQNLAAGGLIKGGAAGT